MTQSVLIVGAGPVGLVAACQLARHGVVPRLIDALPAPTTQYRAVGIQPRALELLATIGVLDRIRELSLSQRGIEIDAPRPDGRQTLTRIELSEVPSRYPEILNLPQTDTEAVLRARAAELGVRVEQAVSLTSLTTSGDGVEVVLGTGAGEERDHLDWVIGADGGHSFVRQSVGSKLEGGFHGSHFVVADASIEAGFARDTFRLFVAPGGFAVALCMLDDRARLMFQIADPGPDAPTPTLADVQRLAHDRMGGDVRVYRPESISHYSIHHAQVPQYRVQRVFLAGDAAHIHSPAGGQGMNTGMQDAGNLGWKLALVCRGLADPVILDSYHDERHPIGADVVRRTTMMADTMTLSGPASHLRDFALRAVGHHTTLREALAESITETRVAYPRSPIAAAAGRRPHHAPAPGDFAADLPGLTTGQGEPVRIGDLLTEPGHLLLTQTTDRALLGRLAELLEGVGRVLPVVKAPDEGWDQAIVDADGVISERYGIGSAGLALIRPDGYFGYLATTIDPDSLEGYLVERLHLTRGQ